MKTYLKGPYPERSEARRLGARWDVARRKWFVEDRDNLWPFIKWMPPHLTRSSRNTTGGRFL